MKLSYTENMIKNIVQVGDEVLRQETKYIEPTDISTEKIQNIIKNLQDTLATQKDGVAIAAPQIGEPYQIFILAPFIFEDPTNEHLVYINPVITHQSKKQKWMTEGCLSIRWKTGEVKRHLETIVEAYDEHGNKFTEHADGFLSQVSQHEIDHLHGILFTDKARNVRDMTEEEIAEITQ